MSRITKTLAAATFFLGVITGFLLGLAAFLNALPTVQSAWCNSVSLLCSYRVVGNTQTVVVQDNGPSHCKPDVRKICSVPTTPYRRLQANTVKFVVTNDTSRYFREREAPHPTFVGVFRAEDDEASTKRYCMTMWSDTGDCNERPRLEGHLEAIEWITIF